MDLCGLMYLILDNKFTLCRRHKLINILNCYNNQAINKPPKSLSIFVKCHRSLVVYI